MKILHTISDLQKIKKGCVLTIGNFDGVHIGHQEILASARRIVVKEATVLVVMTFEPHPVAVLNPDKAHRVLMPLALKKDVLAEAGADYLFVAKSSRKLLSLSPRDFVRQLIFDKMRPSVVVEGESFNFGSARAGSIQTLQRLAGEMGFEVSIIKPKKIKLSTGKIEMVSSTLIRDLLLNGRVTDAALALGRPYRLIGQIVPGQGRGKLLGFPTANMQQPNQLIPEEGVYAGFAGIADSERKACAIQQKVPAAFSIGSRDCIGAKSSLLIEAHLLEENVGKLYGRWLAMDFVKRIRNQQKFDTDAELSARIAKDCRFAGKILY